MAGLRPLGGPRARPKRRDMQKKTAGLCWHMMNLCKNTYSLNGRNTFKNASKNALTNGIVDQ